MFDYVINIKDNICDSVESINHFVGAVVDVTIDEVKDGSSKAWNSITGKSSFDKAETLYKEITEQYNEAQHSYEEQSKILLDSLEKTIISINNHKHEIYKNYFSQFTLLANRLHNLSIKGDSLIEYFHRDIYEIKNLHSMRSKNDLFSIDMNDLKVTEIATSILTLGWSMRKKAAETLENVTNEEEIVTEAINKMNAHITKLEQALSALENVEEYFAVLIHNYEKLLRRFRYGISSQIQKNILNNIALENGKLDFKMMPIVHIEEFQALFNLSIILKTMATMGYLDEQGNVNKEDQQSISNIKHLVNKELAVA